MNKVDFIWKKERGNMSFIYLYCIDDGWKAFGHSAYYLSLLYPELDVARKDWMERDEIQVCVSEEYLLRISEEILTLVGDDYIQVEVPIMLRHKIVHHK